MKESYRAQNSLELKLPSVLPSILCKTKKSLTRRKKKKQTLKLITPSSQPVQPLAHLQNSLPQTFKRELRRTTLEKNRPLKTVDFHVYAYIHFLFSWVSAAAH